MPLLKKIPIPDYFGDQYPMSGICTFNASNIELLRIHVKRRREISKIKIFNPRA